MENLIIDFLVSASELILANRVLGAKSSSDTSAKHSSSASFNLNFPAKFNFKPKIPSEWSSSVHKILVLEFYLKSKEGDAMCLDKDHNLLVEQWNFELSEPDDQKRKLTMESTEQLKLKLTVLLRTISTLSIALPLYRSFLQESGSSLHQEFELDSSIKFSFRLLENWHSAVHEEGLLSSFSNEDVVLPGRTFSFKVNYIKSLTFAQRVAKREKLQTTRSNENQQPPHCKKRTRFLSEEIEIESFKLGANSRRISDCSIKQPRRPAIQESGDENSDFVQWTPRKRYSGNHSLIDSIFGAPSPIEMQKPPKFLFGNSSRKTSIEYQSKSSKEGTRDTNSNASESDDEYHIVESEEEKAKKRSQHAETSPECQSPLFLNAFEGIHAARKGYNEALDKDIKVRPSYRLSKHNSQMENFMQKSDDDKVADILNCLEDIRALDDNIRYCVQISSRQPSNQPHNLGATTQNKETPNLIGRLGIQPDFDVKKTRDFNQELTSLDDFYNELTSSKS